MMRIQETALSVLFCFFFTVHAREASVENNSPDRLSPPGPHVKKVSAGALKKTAFPASKPIVGTYYFYWYDYATKAHFIDGDGTDALTRHPEQPEGYSYKKTSWHLRELKDIRAAGIDFILPVYWGCPDDYASWSFEGLPPLVNAARIYRREGKAPPRIGCFYDTSTLKYNRAGYHADLTTGKGCEWLYTTVRDFFSLIPPDLWAAVDSRPIVWLYSAHFAAAKNETALTYLKNAFAEDFGVAPFIVKEISWPGEADATYAWGAALRPNLHSIAAVGPGYDHSAVPGRSPLVKERENGDFYRRSWRWMLARPLELRPEIAVIETWNEWHEGTDIAPSKESGDFYVKLTRHYTDLWHAQKVLKPAGPHAGKKSVRITLGPENITSGLRQQEAPDGKTKPVERAGKTGRSTKATRHKGRYIYFDAADEFFWAEKEKLSVTIVYFDNRKGTIGVEYDSRDTKAPHNGAFKAAEPLVKAGGGTWKTAVVRLDDAAFTGRANGFDFRIVDHDGMLIVHKVIVAKR